MGINERAVTIATDTTKFWKRPIPAWKNTSVPWALSPMKNGMPQWKLWRSRCRRRFASRAFDGTAKQWRPWSMTISWRNSMRSRGNCAKRFPGIQTISPFRSIFIDGTWESEFSLDWLIDFHDYFPKIFSLAHNVKKSNLCNYFQAVILKKGDQAMIK